MGKLSNIVYEDKLFNENIKLKFIGDYAISTQKILRRIFKISHLIEAELDKDLFEFNREELRRLLFVFQPSTEYSSKANVTWISKYISWAIDEGYKRGLNPLDTVDSAWKEQFVIRSIKKYWTDEELDEIIKDCANFQDSVIISLLRNGAGGKANVEICNLKLSDVNEETSELTLTDENSNKRVIKVSTDCINLCLRAAREYEYEKMNGNPSKDIKSPTIPLISNNYIIRSANTRTIHFEAAEKNIVHRRLVKLANEMNEPHFTPLSISASGMLEMAKNLYAERGGLGDEEYDLIFAQFNELASHKQYRIKNEFLNITTLKDLYKLT